MVEEFKAKKLRNERKFSQWEELPLGGRKYWHEVVGKFGFKARYVKEVDEREETIRFRQEIYDSEGTLIEIHEKFPVDLGHRRAKEGGHES